MPTHVDSIERLFPYDEGLVIGDIVERTPDCLAAIWVPRHGDFFNINGEEVTLSETRQGEYLHRLSVAVVSDIIEDPSYSPRLTQAHLSFGEPVRLELGNRLTATAEILRHTASFTVWAALYQSDREVCNAQFDLAMIPIENPDI